MSTELNAERLLPPPPPGAALRSPEASPFAGIQNAELIAQFYETELDPAIGRELGTRLPKHAGYTGDPAVEPLIGKDGKPMVDPNTGQPLALADYVNYASKHHLYALEEILGFLYTKPGEPEYEDGRAAIAGFMRPTPVSRG